MAVGLVHRLKQPVQAEQERWVLCDGLLGERLDDALPARELAGDLLSEPTVVNAAVGLGIRNVAGGLPAGSESGAPGGQAGRVEGEVRRGLEVLNREVTLHDDADDRGFHPPDGHHALIPGFAALERRGPGQVHPEQPVDAGARFSAGGPTTELRIGVRPHRFDCSLHLRNVHVGDEEPQRGLADAIELGDRVHDPLAFGIGIAGMDDFGRLLQEARDGLQLCFSVVPREINPLVWDHRKRIEAPRFGPEIVVGGCLFEHVTETPRYNVAVAQVDVGSGFRCARLDCGDDGLGNGGFFSDPDAHESLGGRLLL